MKRNKCQPCFELTFRGVLLVIFVLSIIIPEYIVYSTGIDKINEKHSEFNIEIIALQQTNLFSDVVFIIDQSIFVTNEGIGEQISHSINFVLDYLLTVKSHEMSNDEISRFRVGVIFLGDNAKIALPMTELDERSAQIVNEKINSSIQSISIEHVGIERDILSGFQEAENLNSGSESSKKTIVFLTDGLFLEDAIESTRISDELLNYKQSMPEPQNTNVWALIYRESTNKNISSHMPFWMQFVDGNIIAVSIQEEITSALGEIISETMPPKSVNYFWADRESEFNIEHYAQSRIITVIATDSQAYIEFTSPSGEKYYPEPKGENPIIRNISLSLPIESGIWSLHVQGGPVLLLFTPEEIIANIKFTGSTEPVKQYEDVELSFSMIDNKGNLYYESPRNPLIIELKVTDPSGNFQTLNAKYQDSGDYSTTFLADLEGVYSWEAVGKAYVKDSLTTLNKDQGQLRVKPALPMRFQIIEPDSGSKLPIYTDTIPPRMNQISASFFLTEVGNVNPVEINDIWIGDPISMINVELIDLENQLTNIDQIDYANGVFKITFTDVENPGNYELILHMPDPDDFVEGYSPSPAYRTEKATFERFIPLSYKIWSIATNEIALIFYGILFGIALYKVIPMTTQLIKHPEWEREIEGTLFRKGTVGPASVKNIPSFMRKIALKQYYDKNPISLDLKFDNQTSILHVKNYSDVQEVSRVWVSLYKDLLNDQ